MQSSLNPFNIPGGPDPNYPYAQMQQQGPMAVTQQQFLQGMRPLGWMGGGMGGAGAPQQFMPPQSPIPNMAGDYSYFTQYPTQYMNQPGPGMSDLQGYLSAINQQAPMPTAFGADYSRFHNPAWDFARNPTLPPIPQGGGQQYPMPSFNMPAPGSGFPPSSFGGGGGGGGGLPMPTFNMASLGGGGGGGGAALPWRDLPPMPTLPMVAARGESGMTNWFPGGGQPSSGAGQPPATPQGPRPPAQIQTGITQPAMPGRPGTPGMPNLGLRGPAASAFGANARQAMAPAVPQAQGQWSQNNAANNLAFQQARSQSGLGWGGLANQLQQIANQSQLARQQNLFNFLGSMRV